MTPRWHSSYAQNGSITTGSSNGSSTAGGSGTAIVQAQATSPGAGAGASSSSFLRDSADFSWKTGSFTVGADPERRCVAFTPPRFAEWEKPCGLGGRYKRSMTLSYESDL